MSNLDKILSAAKSTGTCYLLDSEAVASLYDMAGKLPEDENSEVQPDYIECIEGHNFLFTGWIMKQQEKEFEFVIKLNKDLTQNEIDSIDFINFEEDDEDEE